MQTFNFEVEPFRAYSAPNEATRVGQFGEVGEWGELEGERGSDRRTRSAQGSYGRSTTSQLRVQPGGYGRTGSQYRRAQGGQFQARPYRIPRRGRWPFVFPYPGASQDDTTVTDPGAVAVPASGTDHIRWVQDSLNRVMDARLPVDGILTADVRSAVSTFQQQAGLPVTGILGPDTERALQDAVSGKQPQ